MRNGAGSGDAPPERMLGSAICIRLAGDARRTNQRCREARPRTIWLTVRLCGKRHTDPRCDGGHEPCLSVIDGTQSVTNAGQSRGAAWPRYVEGKKLMISVQWIAVESIKPSARNRRGRGNALSLLGQAQPLGELSRTSSIESGPALLCRGSGA